MPLCTPYIFGDIGHGYIQYPQDYTREIFQSFSTTANSQLVILRRNELMYYCYIRKLDVENRKIGFCILLNGVSIKKVKELFAIFENVTEGIIKKNKLWGYGYVDNCIVPYIKRFTNEQNEVDRILAKIRDKVMSLDCKTLPSVNYSATQDKQELIFNEITNSEITRISTNTNDSLTFIIKAIPFPPKYFPKQDTQKVSEKNNNNTSALSWTLPPWVVLVLFSIVAFVIFLFKLPFGYALILIFAIITICLALKK